MTPERWKRIEDLALAAMALDLSERADFLDVACDGEASLRQQVEALIESFDQVDSLMAAPTLLRRGRPPAVEGLSPPPGPALDLAAQPRIGPYRLLHAIGQGGMGTVYLAARSDDEFQQSVAVKLLRPGLGSASLMQRFRSERQILASLDHPNIARLLDGGTTGDGWPYFVMELIEGQRIDAYCDRQRLTIRQRLELFREVCGAVAYAHRNLVVHRDIKPSNLLVTEEGIPKLLDFGIAKLLDPTDFPHAVEATRSGLRPMTPPYASPEHIQGRAITTASDVYSLGVLLYKLLAGRLPFATTGLSPEGLERVLIEATPAKPSSAVTRPDPDRQTERRPDTSVPRPIARSRQGRRQLRRQLAGDLDNIVLTALRKEPERRYGSVEQLAEDLRRHLEGLPISARKDTFAYRTGKFLRRHKVAVGIAGSSLVLLSGFAAAMAGQAAQLARQRDRARQERDRAEQVSTFLADVFALVDPYVAKGQTVTVVEILEKGEQKLRQALRDQPGVQASLLHVFGAIYRKCGLYEPAERLLQEALQARRHLLGEEDVEVAESLNELGLLSYDKGRYEQASDFYRRASVIRSDSLGGDHPSVAEALTNLAVSSRADGDVEAADAISRASLEILHRAPDAPDLLLRRALTARAVSLIAIGDYDRAEATLQRALDLRDSGVDDNSHELATAMAHLGAVYLARHHVADAERAFRRAHSMYEQVVGPGHHDVATCIVNIGSCHSLRGELDRARSHCEEALEVLETAVGPNHRNFASALGNLGLIYRRLGRYDRAEAVLDRALEIFSTTVHQGDENVAYATYQLASCLSDRDRFARAELLYRRAEEIHRRSAGPVGAGLSASLSGLAALLGRQGRRAEARELFDESISTCQQAATRDPDNLKLQNHLAFAHIGLGDLHRSAGRDREAQRHWRRSLSLAEGVSSRSELVEARDLHCGALLRLGRIDAARPIAESLLAAGWRAPDVLRRCREHRLIGPGSES